jgi:hypothetical protein
MNSAGGEDPFSLRGEKDPRQAEVRPHPRGEGKESDGTHTFESNVQSRRSAEAVQCLRTTRAGIVSATGQDWTEGAPSPPSPLPSLSASAASEETAGADAIRGEGGRKTRDPRRDKSFQGAAHRSKRFFARLGPDRKGGTGCGTGLERWDGTGMMGRDWNDGVP